MDTKLTLFPFKGGTPGLLAWRCGATLVMAREFTREPPPFLCALLCCVACQKVEGKHTWFSTRRGLRIVPLVLRRFHQCQCVPRRFHLLPVATSSPPRYCIRLAVCTPPTPHPRPRASIVLSRSEISAFPLTISWCCLF